MAMYGWLDILEFVAPIDSDLMSCQLGSVVNLLVNVEEISVFDDGVGPSLLPVPHAMVVMGWYKWSEL
jgi:hypothetical protein